LMVPVYLGLLVPRRRWAAALRSDTAGGR